MRVASIPLPSAILLALPIAALLLCAAAAPAQIVGGQQAEWFQFDGLNSKDDFGSSVSSAGDVDGDGFDDLLIGAQFADPAFLTDSGAAIVLSGATGAVFFQFNGLRLGDKLGSSVSGAGDTNGDGVPDFILGAPVADPNGVLAAGSAFVHSGADGSLLWRFDGTEIGQVHGRAVSGAGDVNADGFDDVIVGAQASSPGGKLFAGSAFVYSGLDGSTLWRVDGSAANDLLGNSVSDAGDVNADGFADFIAGAPNADPLGKSSAGSAYVVSGADGSLLHQFDGEAADDQLGYDVAGAGDVNADGFDDVIVGAYFADPGGRSEAGSAYVFSGADGSLLWRFEGSVAGDELGISVSGAGDANADGFADLLVGAATTAPGGRIDAGSAYVFSGADGSLLWQIDGESAGDELGTAVSCAGDVRGNGYADQIVGAHLTEVGGDVDVGSVYVFGWDPFLTASASEISAASGGTVDFVIDFPVTESGFDYAMLASGTGTGPLNVNGVDIPLTNDVWFQRMVSGNPPPGFAGTSGTLDGSGNASSQFTAAPGLLAAVVGNTFWFAAVSYVPPQGVRLSTVAHPIEILP